MRVKKKEENIAIEKMAAAMEERMSSRTEKCKCSLR